MINLLPIENRRQLQQEYRLRFIILALTFLFVVVGVGTVILLPDVLSISSEYFSIHRGDSEPAKPEQGEEEEALLAEIKSFREALITLDAKTEKPGVSLFELLQQVVPQKPNGVSLRSFLFVANSEFDKNLVISGISRDRESLVLFSKSLSENSVFSKVDLPLSSLSQKEDIEFSVTLVMKQEKKDKEEGKEEVKETSEQ